MLNPWKRLHELEAQVAEADAAIADWRVPAELLEADSPAELLDRVQEVAEAWTQAQRTIEDATWVDVTKGGSLSGPSVGDLKTMRSEATVFARENPLVKQAHNLRTWFTFGTGLPCPTIKHEDAAKAEAAQAVIDDVWRDPDNRRTWTSFSAQEKLSRKVLQEGDLYLLLFAHDVTGHTKVRVCDANEIIGTVCAPGDRNRVLYYIRQVTEQTWNYQEDGPGLPSTNKVYHPDYRLDKWLADGNKDPLPENKPRGEGYVYHESLNATTNDQTGIPESYAATKWVRVHRDISTDLATLVRSLASIAWRKKVKGTAAQTSAAANALRPAANGGLTNPPPRAGSVVVENERVDWSAMPMQTAGVSNGIEGATVMRRMAVTSFGFNDHYFANPENANLATATMMEAPVLKMIEASQQWWTCVYVDVLVFVLARAAARLGIAPEDVVDYTIDVDFPPIVTKDLATFVDALTKARDAGIMTREQAATLALTAFGTNNVTEEVERVLGEEPPAKPEPGTPTTPPEPAVVGSTHEAGCTCSESHGDPATHNVWTCCCPDCQKRVEEVCEAYSADGVLSGIEAADFEPLYPSLRLIGILLYRAKEAKSRGETLTAEEIQKEMDALLKTLDTAMALVVPKYQKLLKPIMGLLTDDLGAALAGNVDPYSLSQVWQQKWAQYGSYDFTRMARTEVAFGENDATVAALKHDFEATDELFSKTGFGRPPFHPNCLCGLTTLEGSDGVVYMVPQTIPSACAVCHDIADTIFALVPE